MTRICTSFLILSALLASGCPSTAGPQDTSLVATAHAAPPPSSVGLDPRRGDEVGLVFEAFLSPQQEPGEESDTPKSTPAMFRSTTPSLTRDERVAAGHRGHGVFRFSKDLSRVWIDVKIEGVDLETINMFHVHCGGPGILGPILLDFAQVTDLRQNFADDGVLSVEVTNAHIVATAEHGHGAIAAFTAGCVIPGPSLAPGLPSKVSTVAGMAHIASEGELYFNLHTSGQMYFGDLRGQVLPAQ
ncbi:MAG: CHRD domain-containing protein [Enhygromyxa sp.]